MPIYLCCLFCVWFWFLRAFVCVCRFIFVTVQKFWVCFSVKILLLLFQLCYSISLMIIWIVGFCLSKFDRLSSSHLVYSSFCDWNVVFLLDSNIFLPSERAKWWSHRHMHTCSLQSVGLWKRLTFNLIKNVVLLCFVYFIVAFVRCSMMDVNCHWFGAINVGSKLF